MNFDYNLLKVLAVILETRNTTTAAERLYTSQPAVSRSLRKIRDLFNDDILVRKGTNMELTPKAEEIKAQLSGIINDIDKLVNVSHSFDPATESSVLRAACCDQLVHCTMVFCRVYSAASQGSAVYELGDRRLDGNHARQNRCG